MTMGFLRKTSGSCAPPALAPPNAPSMVAAKSLPTSSTTSLPSSSSSPSSLDLLLLLHLHLLLVRLPPFAPPDPPSD